MCDSVEYLRDGPASPVQFAIASWRGELVLARGIRRIVPRKKPRVVSLDEVKIHRRGMTAEFEYADEEMGGMSLTLGVDVEAMSDEALLEKHNQAVRAMQELADSYEHVAVEVPVGRPQIRYFELGRQWTPRGHVLRCVVHDGGTDGDATIEIDDHELSLREFGRLLTTYAGWGMRIVFVPEDEIHEQPVIEVREPVDPGPPVLSPTTEEGDHGTRSPRSPSRSAGRPTAKTPRTSTPRDRLLLRLPVYRLRITLVGTEPPVWRTVLISGNQTLRKVHDVFQTVMGWTNSHLHLFASDDREDVVSDPRFELDEARDETRVKLRSFATISTSSSTSHTGSSASSASGTRRARSRRPSGDEPSSARSRLSRRAR